MTESKTTEQFQELRKWIELFFNRMSESEVDAGRVWEMQYLTINETAYKELQQLLIDTEQTK
jgi:hypothetical protein